MTFLALMIALGLMHYWGTSGFLHRDGWFAAFTKTVDRFGLAPPLQLALVVLVPALVVYGALAAVDGWLFGGVALALAVVVLWYSFGREDFDELIGYYRERCGHGDMEGAYLFALEKLSAGDEDIPSDNPASLHQWVKRHFCYLAFEHWFAVAFYFVLLGAPGALAYRVLHLHRQGQRGQHGEEDEPQRRLTARVLHVVDWVPVRLLALAFAATGDWMSSHSQVAGSLGDTDTPAPDIIADTADAALGLKAAAPTGDDGDVGDTADADATSDTISNTGEFAEACDREMGELHRLLTRSGVAWVAALSLFVLAR